MKGTENGWEQTPRIRLSLLGYNRPSIVNRPEPSYPPPDFRYTTLYLDAKTSSLQSPLPPEPATATYQADSRSDNGVGFTFKFDTYTELCGISKAKLFMSAVDHDDMVRTPDASSKQGAD